MIQPALRLAFHLSIAALLILATNAAADEPLVPGTGEFIAKVGDDFEDPNWGYKYNNPKNSQELDGEARNPGGYSLNRRWFEGPLRGHPDLLKRVPTPAGKTFADTAGDPGKYPSDTSAACDVAVRCPSDPTVNEYAVPLYPPTRYSRPLYQAGVDKIPGATFGGVRCPDPSGTEFSA